MSFPFCQAASKFGSIPLPYIGSSPLKTAAAVIFFYFPPNMRRGVLKNAQNGKIG